MLESGDGIARDPAFKRKRRNFKWPGPSSSSSSSSWRKKRERKEAPRRERRETAVAKIPRVGRTDILMEMAGGERRSSSANGSREMSGLAYPV